MGTKVSKTDHFSISQRSNGQVRVRSGTQYESVCNYSRAVVIEGEGRSWILVSGTTGIDYETGCLVPGVEAQTDKCFENISGALKSAGAELRHLVRVRIYLSDGGDFSAIAPIVGRACAEGMPANTTVVAQMIDPEMRIEIEALAFKPTAE